MFPWRSVRDRRLLIALHASLTQRQFNDGTGLRASRDLYGNQQTACMEARQASKASLSSSNHQLLRSSPGQRRTASIVVASRCCSRSRDEAA